MDKVTLPGDPPLEVRLRRTARARRLSLRVSRADARVTLSLPVRAPRAAAVDFVREKEAWLRRTLDSLPQANTVGPGMEIPFAGERIPLAAAPLRRARLEQGVLLVPPGARAGPAAAAFLKEAARARLEPACHAHAAALERVPGRITLRDTRSRWGSCTEAGRLMFSWRLVMAPPAVLDYVAAHEVAHLVEMNHAAAFWSLVAQLVPGWRRERDWLRRHGSELLSYRFHD